MQAYNGYWGQGCELEFEEVMVIVWSLTHVVCFKRWVDLALYKLCILFCWFFLFGFNWSWGWGMVLKPVLRLWCGVETYVGSALKIRF